RRGLESLRCELGLHEFGAQLDVLGAQLRLAGKEISDAAKCRRRRGRCDLERLRCECERAAQALGIAKTCVENDQGEGQQRKEDQPNDRSRPTVEECRRCVLHLLQGDRPPGAYSFVKIGPKRSIFSSACPEPRTTQVHGSSAKLVRTPAFSISRRSSAR